MAHDSDQARRDQLEAMYQKVRRSFPEVAELTVEEFRLRNRDEEMVLVDVRAEEEQAVSMIPGAITARDFEELEEEYRGKAVVTYCTVGGRSGMYARDLTAKGWTVYNLEGAILAWTLDGGPLIDADGPTKRVHVYSRRHNLAADGYEPVW